MSAFTDYLKGVRSELTHVSWPTTNQAIAYTGLVILISLAVSFILGGFDYVFNYGLELFLSFFI